MTSGTNLHSRYHPDYLPKGDPLRTSGKVLPCNGSPRAPLLLFHRADSGTRSSQGSAPASTSRRLSGAHHRDKFSIHVFYMVYVKLNHKNALLSTGNVEQFSLLPESLLWGQKHLTFACGHGIMFAISEKGFDEDGQTWKSPQRAGIWCESAACVSKDPSLPSRSAEIIRRSRLPALRDRAYWSLK